MRSATFLHIDKKLAVLGWIFRKGLITEDEYSIATHSLTFIFRIIV